MRWWPSWRPRWSRDGSFHSRCWCRFSACRSARLVSFWGCTGPPTSSGALPPGGFSRRSARSRRTPPPSVTCGGNGAHSRRRGSDVDRRADTGAWHALEASEVGERFGTGPRGLGEEEAERRRKEYGPNELPRAKPESAWIVFFRQFASPLIYILLVALAITVVLGAYVDASVIAAAILLDVVIGFFQERKAEASVRALMRLLSPKAQVVRDGRVLEIESRFLVPGDR